ncbi:aerobic-type carbon monoxide dehydrogenase small subunit (CoxS/CutS family) [Mycobacterium sp. URHB0021]
MHDRPVQVSVNGRATEATVEPRLTLADYLRDNCGLTAPTSAANTVRAGRAPCSSTGRPCGPA